MKNNTDIYLDGGKKQRRSERLVADKEYRELAELRKGWAEVRRGFGSLELSKLGAGEFVTASGLHDGGYIVWRKCDSRSL